MLTGDSENSHLRKRSGVGERNQGAVSGQTTGLQGLKSLRSTDF